MTPVLPLGSVACWVGGGTGGEGATRRNIATRLAGASYRACRPAAAACRVPEWEPRLLLAFSSQTPGLESWGEIIIDLHTCLLVSWPQSGPRAAS